MPDPNDQKVQDLKVLLPQPAKVGEDEWDNIKLAAMLDAGNTPAKVMSMYWHAQAAQSATYVDISESGSSRNLSTVYKNAIELAKYWDSRVEQEEQEETQPETRQRITFHRARRV